MLFNSLLFIFWCLPVILLLYFISPHKLRNFTLLLTGLLLYAWGGLNNTVILLGSILLNYTAGLMIARSAGRTRNYLLFTAIFLNLMLLAVFKYTQFIFENVNVLVSLLGMHPIVVNQLLMPLGISFFTFRSITYLVSVKRSENPPQRNFIDMALYISLFAELPAGPIDRYRTLSPQIAHRKITLEGFSSGIARFSLGLGKKVIISSPLGAVADQVFSPGFDGLSLPMAWFGAACYSLQVYYDFSGYTDMAIGLGRMFGFTFTENFNFPYYSRSVREFWRRWHITLSTWLRDYLFLPLAFALSRQLKKDRYAGMRTDNIIYIAAILLTFLVCGLWHGPAWHFVAWGLLHGLLLSLEKTRFGKWLDRGYRFTGHIYLVFIVLITMVFFRAESLMLAVGYTGAMFGIVSSPVIWAPFSEYLTREFVVVAILAVSGSTPVFSVMLNRIRNLAGGPGTLTGKILYNTIETGRVAAVSVLLFYSALQLLAKTNLPFIYFRF